MGEEENIEPTEAKEVEEDSTSKIARKRKKHLYNSIKDLMEFWFSDVNLGKDRFLSQLMYTDSWIDIEVFQKFNKLRALTTDVNDIVKALRKSKMLQISEDEKKVCRITPFTQKPDVDACTIYVEQFQPDAEHDWLKSVFSEYGPIDYISLPRFKATQKPKGFAFIEFKDPESANRAIEAFRAKGCCLSPQMDPDKLMSIATFEKNDEQSNKNEQFEEEIGDEESKNDKNIKHENIKETKDIKNEWDDNAKDVKKKHRSKSESNADENVDHESGDDVKDKKLNKRKRKSSGHYVVDEEVDAKKPLKRSKRVSECGENEEKKNKKDKMAAEDENDSTNMEMEAEDTSDKQKKGKAEVTAEADKEDAEKSENIEEGMDENENEDKKKKRKRKKKHKKQSHLVSLGLQIMPKVEWKRLRNKYLNLQKQKMQHLKQHLRQSRWEQRKSRWHTSNYENEENKIDVDKNVQEKKKGLEFTPGVIVKVVLDEPVSDVKGMKIEARIHPEVRYVDASEGDKEIYLRVGGPELVEQVLNAKKWPNMEVLKGKEEKAYWDKILKDREEKFTKKIRSNLRGRDKLLKKAEKFQGKHVGFDEH